ncbi:MAG: hypothetical protein ACRDYE_15320, partial [Acidimicrobiales bacterium]
RRRFAAGLGVLTLVGSAALVLAVSHVVGIVFGYLVIWAVIIPVSALIGLGLVPFPVRFSVPFSVRHRSAAPHRSGPPVRVARPALATLALLAAVVLTVRVSRLPSLGSVSDQHVEQLTTLVVPALDQHGTVFVGDDGAGSRTTRLVDAEEFIGLVDQLDVRGYRPTVNHLWKAEFGPGYLSSGEDGQQIRLSTWTPASPAQPGYRGRVGDIAVAVADAGRT